MSGMAYSCPSGRLSPRARSTSGAAATTRGPPTCGATARSTPRMSSAEAPSSTALVICHAYDAGGASSAMSAAIFTSANVLASNPVAARCDSRSPTAASSRSRSPAEMPLRVSCVSCATAAIWLLSACLTCARRYVRPGIAARVRAPETRVGSGPFGGVPGGDGAERAQRRPCPLGLDGGGGGAGVRAGDARVQDPGMGAEAQRRLQPHRLAVDARGDRAAGLAVERGGGPLLDRRAGRAGRAEPRDAEHALVQARARARADRPAEPVAVVGDEDRRRRVPRQAVAAGEVQAVAVRAGRQRLGQGVQQRA